MNDKEKAQWLAEFYQKLADNNNGFTYLGGHNCHGPNMYGNIDYESYAINENPPKKKIIDLHMMVGMEVDMEFSNKTGHGDAIGYLDDIDEYGYFNGHSDSYYKECRIRQDYWHSWCGDVVPIPEGLKIEIRYRNRSGLKAIKVLTDYSKLKWTTVDAFKVLGVLDNYHYEWKKE